ncbi:MAG: hypothetical protein JWM73_1922 [Solirubrobacterales bacterium]|nr:hypothetical protein [Solirubrobacterales bacterium]
MTLSPRMLIPLGLAATAIGAAGCGSTASSSGATSPPSTTPVTAPVTAGGAIKGTLDEWSVHVAKATAPAGKVTFDIANQGKMVHEFVVLRTTKQAGALGTGARVSEAGNAGETGDIAPGRSKRVTIDLKPGHYSLVCNLPAHYASGMHTDFTVG